MKMVETLRVEKLRFPVYHVSPAFTSQIFYKHGFRNFRTTRAAIFMESIAFSIEQWC